MRMVVSAEATVDSYRVATATRPKPYLIGGEEWPAELCSDHCAAAGEVGEPQPAARCFRSTANDVETEPRRPARAAPPLAKFIAAEARAFISHDDRAAPIGPRFDVHIEPCALRGVREHVLQQRIDGYCDVPSGTSDDHVLGRQVGFGTPTLILGENAPECEPFTHDHHQIRGGVEFLTQWSARRLDDVVNGAFERRYMLSEASGIDGARPRVCIKAQRRYWCAQTV